jgi:hypothetical protein
MRKPTSNDPDGLIAELMKKGTPGIETAVRAAEEVESIYYRAIAATTPDLRVKTELKSPRPGVVAH